MRSASTYDRMRTRVPGGVSSDFQWRAPHPIYLKRGNGARVVDVDGNEYVDFHMGAGSATTGHAHPVVAEAVRRATSVAMCMAAPSTDCFAVAEALGNRFELPLWRFMNSGTEATMTAIRIARALTDRPLVVRLQDAYHGHHDAALAKFGRNDRSSDIEAWERGVPKDVIELTRLVQCNDTEGLRQAFSTEGERIACVLVELPLLSPTFTMPTPEFLTVLRSICSEYGALLVVDEVKTGVTVAYGGGSRWLSVSADLVATGKSIAGGVACGAVGGTLEAMGGVGSSGARVVGTFNGNPLGMAAAHAALTEVLVPEAYEDFGRLGRALTDALERYQSHSRVSFSAQIWGSKGSISFTAGAIRFSPDLVSELVWTALMNRGIYLAPAPDLRFSLSVAHSVADVERLAAAIAEAAQMLIEEEILT